jgi:hypothetical protein
MDREKAELLCVIMRACMESEKSLPEIEERLDWVIKAAGVFTSDKANAVHKFNSIWLEYLADVEL